MDTNTHLQGFTHIHTFIQNTRSYTHSGDVEIIRTPITHWLCEDISTLLMHVVLLKRPDLYRKLSFTHTFMGIGHYRDTNHTLALWGH